MTMKQDILLFILAQKQKQYLIKGSGWVIDLFIDDIINISKYNPLAGSSYIKLPKKLNHQKTD